MVTEIIIVYETVIKLTLKQVALKRIQMSVHLTAQDRSMS